VIVCTLFGVSMDYEVFMLSRISEAYRAGATNRDAVAIGLVATGPIITSAASILVVVGLAFTTANVVIVKELGLGLALAIGLDATVIRSLLVPATMRVLGDWNWWPGGRRGPARTR
jgi:RND superfamily putative drug exporter